MDELLVDVVMSWSAAHPVATARILMTCTVFILIGNLCRWMETRFDTTRWPPRARIALQIGATTGNVVMGLWTLAAAFVKGKDDDLLPPPSV